MKKLSFILIFSWAVTNAFGQASAVGKAERYQQSGDLKAAKEQIDLALAHEKTKDKAKTWYVKGQVYESIATSEKPEDKELAPDALQQAIEAYNKVAGMEKEALLKLYSEQRLDALWGTFLNQGATAYQNEDFPLALEAFNRAIQIKPKDTTAYLYAGIAAQQDGKYDLALKNYYSLIDLGYNDPEIYSSIIVIERSENKNNDKALEVIQKARQKFPDNKDLMKEEINLLIVTKKTDEAKAKLEAAIKAEPDNANLYYNLAYLYEQVEDDEKAVTNYKKAIDLNPEYFEANFNMGVFYYNKAADILKEANNMDLKTYEKEGKKLEDKATEYFKLSLPFMEKAHQIQPNEVTVLETLDTLYTRLRMEAKSKETEAKLKALGSTTE